MSIDANEFQSKIRNKMANCVNPDETAHNDPTHQDLHCLHWYLFCLLGWKVMHSLCLKLYLKSVQNVFSHLMICLPLSLSYTTVKNSNLSNHCRFICLFNLRFTSRWTIFQSCWDGVWMWQGAQCSLLQCCLTEISHPRYISWWTQSHWHYTHTGLTSSSSAFLLRSSKQKSS